MNNPEKTFHCTEKGVYVCYADSKKHSYIPYENKNILQIQLYGNTCNEKSYQTFEEDKYSFKQNRLYQQCVFGLKALSLTEMKTLTFKEKVIIQINHKKTQKLINLSKWKATSDLVKKTCLQSFAKINSTFMSFLTVTDEILPTDNEQLNMLSLKSIGGKDALINNLIKCNILPLNFFNL